MSDTEGKSGKEVKIAIIGAAATILAAIISILGSRYADRPKPATSPSDVRLDVHVNPPDDHKADASLTPARHAETDNPVRPPEPTPPSFAEQIEGEYLLQSYALYGMALPLQGGMTLRHLSSTELQFDSTLTRSDMPGSYFAYRGAMRSLGGAWQIAVTATNDPTIPVGQWVTNAVTYQGGLLTFQSEVGQVILWRRK